MSLAQVSLPQDSPDPMQWCSQTKTLSIDWSEALRYPCRLYIPGWDDALNWYSEIYHEQEPSHLLEEPGIDLLKPTDNPYITAWQKTIPADLLEALSGFYRYQFVILRLVSQWPEARDLLKSNPTLLWLWVAFCQERKASESTILRGLRSKQPNVLSAMGLHGTSSSVRMLKRLQPDILDDALNRKIHKLWSRPQALDTLRHVPVITEVHLGLLHHNENLIGHPLFYAMAELNCHWQRQEALLLFRDCLRMGLRADHQLRQCRTIESLNRIHDRHAVQLYGGRYNNARVSVLKDENGSPLPFPAPPHPGTDLIKPITTPDELIKEGSVMHHCVGSYVRTVQEGKSYIYHMMEPQRVTIGLNLRDGKVVKLEQVKGRLNASASKDTMDIVRSWMAEVLSSR
ncbi:PcfJ domain-containing protein [Parendozoicomonas haliclonae]|uniref:PcfJ-like protein n=1 Tax=Parendozoicomonas haliclonae TaxID=1960125 RepID=A0A1X7AKP1_9GAMM|nr:PcfJ domain-containing protein [Parendozoicomonas haliclonae]SMA48228.1 hypothetical protein EHSB41UT_02658 [Parendozoicomonas haliclonae]